MDRMHSLSVKEKINSKEILDAEKWARANNLPFPPVADNPAIKGKDIRECYVFEDPDDPRCPTILHFVLINETFKDYVAPGKVEENFQYI